MSTLVQEMPVIIEENQTQARVDDYDEKYAHWVDAEKANKAAITGNPVVAMCGKVWRPKGNPEEHPVCPQCEKLLNEIGKVI